MNKLENEKLEYVLEQIKKTTNPKKIYLFGSYATGKETAESDFDLCIISDEKKRKIELLREIRFATVNKIDIPMDLIIYREDEFLTRSGNLNSFEREIIEKGVLLYDAETRAS
jgi:predicted nucleotidyltransferase